jgi:hypothetical protein
MRGLPSDERALLLRLGNLMDAALNNRQPSNPFEDSRNVSNPKVYPPTGLLAKIGIQNVKLIWDPPANIQLLRYEVTFLNLTTGVTTKLSSYTSEITYKAPQGEYHATVRSIGRNGEASLVKEIDFTVGDEIMQIEGAKNGPTELGTMVQDSILLKQGQSVYIWGSVVLDKYIAGLNIGNPVEIFNLWRADGANADFINATLVQTITLYAATESASSFDDTALGGTIIRPLPLARAGSFETSQSVMFSPIEVDDDEDMTTVTFFLQATHRETPLDEVCLSLVMWTGDHGFGDAVPGDNVEVFPEILPHRNSFHAQSVGDVDVTFDIRSVWSFIPNGYSLIGNRWTIGAFVRFDNLSAIDLAATRDPVSNPTGGTQNVFTKNVLSSSGNAKNGISTFQITGEQDLSNYYHRITIILNDVNGPSEGGVARTVRYRALCTGSRKEVSDLFPGGDAASGLDGAGWYFIALHFSGGLFSGGVPKARLMIGQYKDNPTILDPLTMTLLVPISDASTSPIVMDDTGRMGYTVGCPYVDGLGAGSTFEGIYNGDKRENLMSHTQWHRLGIWNEPLDRGMGTTLPSQWILRGGEDNDDDATALDWKDSQDTYTGLFAWQNYNGAWLRHENKFGNIEQPFETTLPCRDDGINIWNGDLNWTKVIEPFREPDPSVPSQYHKRLIDSTYLLQTGNSWTDNTSIADILSPHGDNGTTQFGYAYPGQEGVVE